MSMLAHVMEEKLKGKGIFEECEKISTRTLIVRDLGNIVKIGDNWFDLDSNTQHPHVK